MIELSKYLTEGFYKNVGNRELQKWYDQQHSTTFHPNPSVGNWGYIDKDTNELVFRSYRPAQEIRLDIYDYFQYFKDFRYESFSSDSGADVFIMRFDRAERDRTGYVEYWERLYIRVYQRNREIIVNKEILGKPNSNKILLKKSL